MATLTLTWNTGATPLAKIIDAFATAYNYQPLIGGLPNPESKSEFARRMVGNYIKGIVKGQDEQAALTTVAAQITEITLT